MKSKLSLNHVGLILTLVAVLGIGLSGCFLGNPEQLVNKALYTPTLDATVPSLKTQVVIYATEVGLARTAQIEQATMAVALRSTVAAQSTNLASAYVTMTACPTATATPTPTPSPTPCIVFRDDFEDSEIEKRWRLDVEEDGWRVEQYEGKDHVLCIHPVTGFGSIYAGANWWEDYVLDLDVMVRKDAKQPSAILALHSMTPTLRYIQYKFEPEKSVLEKVVYSEGGDSQSAVVTDLATWEGGLFADGMWHRVSLRAAASNVEVIVDGEPKLKSSANEFDAADGLNSGSIGFSVAPEAHICFDNVTVVEYRRCQ